LPGDFYSVVGEYLIDVLALPANFYIFSLVKFLVNQIVILMKNVLGYTVLLGCLLLLMGCKGESDRNISEQEAENLITHTEAVCIWDRVALRESPSEKGKWLASVSLGEKVTYLEETAVDSSGSRAISYYKIALADGKDGWIRSDFVLLDGKPAVFLSTTPYYSRPDLLTKTERTFSMMDIVGIRDSQGDWIEVSGKRSGGTWIESGWIKSANISTRDVDIAVAKFAGAALANTDEEKKVEAIKEILENPDLTGSAFAVTLADIVRDLSVNVEEPLELPEEEL
jgi:hypothetical protein